MSTNVTSVTNHFPFPQNGFTTTTSGSVSSGATSVGLNSVAGYTNGQTVVFVIDPTDATKKQTFTGVMDTSGSQVTSVVWTAGTNQTHALGATIVDYATATHIGMISKGIKVHANEDGSLITQAVRDALNLDSGTSTGWTVLGYTLNTVAANGNRSYTCTFNSNDLTSTLSAGMRLRTTRTVSAPTQCTSLNGTTQYYSKSSPSAMTFTDDFTVSAWVKLSSYPSASASIASRFNGTSGWSMYVLTNGTVALYGFNGGAGNVSNVVSYQSLPLNKWVHVSAQLDMSAFTATTTTSYVMMDGVDVPAVVARSGTNPTALIQAGDLEIGALNGAGGFFPGKIAQVAIYNAKVTQATIKASISQGLSGSETSLISAYSFNNTINDLSANANNLTANGAAVATNADSPFGTQASGLISATLDYGIIQSVTFSTNTTVVVQVPEGCTIPTSGGVSAVSYSTQKVPYGFPAQRGKWRVQSIQKSQQNSGSIASGAISNVGSYQLTAPIGEGLLAYEVTCQQNPASGNNGIFSVNLSTSSTVYGDNELTTVTNNALGSTVLAVAITAARSTDVSNSSATPYYFLMKNEAAPNATMYLISSTVAAKIYWEPATL